MSLQKPTFLRILTAALLIFNCSLAFAKEGNDNGMITADDKIIKMHGYILDTVSESPNTLPVEAKIVLQSIPHGSEIGIISSDDSSGYFEYYINLKNTYQIDVQSDQYRYVSESFIPNEHVEQDEIFVTYYLQPEVRENQVIRLNKLIFDQGKSTITSESYGELDKLVRLMGRYSAMQIQLEGHTDYRGSKKLNQQLSQDRVDAVKEYLEGKGVQSKRVKTKAFGGTQPLVKESSLKASEINRRVEVRILKID